MKKHIILAGLSVLGLAACSIRGGGDPTAQTEGRVVLDVACIDDADCPGGFECEDEIEHGVAKSFCVSHGGGTDDGVPAEGGACPAGFEIEVEHGETLCKPHGGHDDDDGSGEATEGAPCATAGDCASGLECEVEVEHGSTTGVCRAHGGGGHG
jgi:hypothetical protein